MVATSPEQLRDEAVVLFRQDELSPAFAWVEDLSPVHQRRFWVELADTIKEITLSGDPSPLTFLVDGWEATAELDSAPEVIDEIRRLKTFKPLQAFSA